jgi:hypothetical protein
MSGLFVVGLIAVIGLVFIGLLALFVIPFLLALIPITHVGLFLWKGIHWIVGLASFIFMGVASVLQTLWHTLF